MNGRHDPTETDDSSSEPDDLLDVGLAAGFGRAEPPRSTLGAMRPELLKETDGESVTIVHPKSDVTPSPEQTGDRYQLQDEIARGGMGVVLRGRDVFLGRDLAVKVLLEKYVHRPEVARRFIEEAQIGGQLQHPGVVPVYDIGRFGDRPFFTMKLVKGQTLAALLSQRETPVAHAPGSPTDRARFLAIALRVAQTLAYAHVKGVIHRDLKPANIMVGAFGEVQVMDWGLAKVLAEGGIADEEQASRAHEQLEDVTTIRTARSSSSAGSFGTDTEAGSFLGTPAYVSPEQANGDIANLDRRADVFGLGAILCEILTGKPPYVGRSAEELRRKAANGDLADAHARLGVCGADPELVILTKACLAPEPIDRLRDARAVADGLTTYLDGVQERLRQAELAEAEAKAKAIEEAKERRLTMALAATVLLALTLGGGGWLYVKAERDARQVQMTREVNDALNKATALREQAKVANVGGAGLFAQAREQAQRALALVENGPADAVLKELVRQLQAELDEEEKDRTLLAALEEARLMQAETHSVRGFTFERAVPKFRKAFRVYGLVVGEGEPKIAAERIRQRPAAVQEAIVAALDEWDGLAGDLKLGIAEPHQEWLRAVVEAAEPDDAWGRQVRAARRETDEVKRQAALEALAKSDGVAKRPVRALTRLATAGLRPPQDVELLRLAQQSYPSDFWVNHDLGVKLQGMTPPEWDEAVRFLTVAVALRPDSSGVHCNLGNPLYYKGKSDEAIACYKKALELDPKLVAARTNLGLALKDTGRLEEAMANFRKAVEIDPKNADARNGLADLLTNAADPKLRDPVQAIAEARIATELDPKLANAWSTLGEAFYRAGRWQEAIAALDKGLALSQSGMSEEFFFLAMAHERAGHKDKARQWYDKGIVWMDKHAPKDAALLRHRAEAANVLGVK